MFLHPVIRRHTPSRTITSGSRRYRHPHAGFTLVEVVVAVLLLALAALGVASTTTFVARLAASARAIALATRTLALVVDSLRASPCQAIGTGSVGTVAGSVAWTTAVAGNTRHLRAVLTPVSPRVATFPYEEVTIPCE